MQSPSRGTSSLSSGFLCRTENAAPRGDCRVCFRGRLPCHEFDGLLDRNIGWLGVARFTASASDGSCRSMCSNLSFRYTQALNRDVDDGNRRWRGRRACPLAEPRRMPKEDAYELPGLDLCTPAGG